MRPLPLDQATRMTGILLLGGALWAAVGCNMQNVRSQSPDADITAEIEPTTNLVGDVAGPHGMNYHRVEAVGMVTHLPDTGSDPPPSPEREMLISEIQAREVRSPATLLASPANSLVLLKAYIPPGAQKGDKVDVLVSVPARSETTSLRRGWLMQTRLHEQAMLGNQLRNGHYLVSGQGPVLVDAEVENSSDKVHEVRGRVLAGGVVRKSRPLGLAIREGHHSVATSSMIGAAVNRRFHSFEKGVKKGVANPVRDNYIELTIHPRYKNNVSRYVRVVTSIPLRESAAERIRRMELLETQLFQPTSARTAALQLEAIGGEEVTPILTKAIASPDVEVRFYAAEALAYLNKAEAAAPLGEIAGNEPAFRWHALTALAAMDDFAAYDSLVELLHVRSAEARYGAFRALKARSENDPLIADENLAGEFYYHVIPTTGDPMVHVTRTRVPEVVLFGPEQRLVTPVLLFAGKEIMIKSTEDDRLKVSRFAADEPDRHQECEPTIDAMVRTLAELGASYPEVVSALHQAKQRNYLGSRFVVDALPRAGRRFLRDDASEAYEGAEELAEHSTAIVPGPLPSLFSEEPDDARSARSPSSGEIHDDEKQPSWWNFFGG